MMCYHYTPTRIAKIPKPGKKSIAGKGIKQQGFLFIAEENMEW